MYTYSKIKKIRIVLNKLLLKKNGRGSVIDESFCIYLIFLKYFKIVSENYISKGRNILN